VRAEVAENAGKRRQVVTPRSPRNAKQETG